MKMLVQRVLALEFLLDLHRRGVHERRREAARLALQWRTKMLRTMKEKRGYEG
jgi:hypothetical protein